MGREEDSRAGHRSRQRERLLASGAGALSDKELLEMLLYYAIPRVDTKPIAHELLERYGSIANILAADREEIRRISGIKDSAEILFSLLREVCVRGAAGKDLNSFFDKSYVSRYLLDLYGSLTTEHVYAFFLDNSGCLLAKQLIFRGGVSSAKFPLRPVTEGAIRSGACSVIIAHNHPSGSPIPSGDDIFTTDRVASHLSANDIELVEHYVVGRDSVIGILSQKMR